MLSAAVHVGHESTTRTTKGLEVCEHAVCIRLDVSLTHPIQGNPRKIERRIAGVLWIWLNSGLLKDIRRCIQRTFLGKWHTRL